MNWKEKLEKAALLFEQAKAILNEAVPVEGGKEGETREATPEEREHVQEMIDDAKKLQAEALRAKKLEELMAEGKAVAEAAQADAGQESPEPTYDPEVDDKFDDWGEFLYHTWQAQAGKVLEPDERLQYFKDDAPGSKKDLTEGTGAQGGFLVPTEFRDTLYGIMDEESFVRRRATVIPMTRRQVRRQLHLPKHL